MKVNISGYASEKVGTDWGPAIEAAWADVRATGGTIYFDEPEVLIESEIDLGPPSYSLVPLILQGDGASVIRIDTGTSVRGFAVSNKMNFEVRDLVFASTDLTGSGVDCSRVFDVTSTQNFIIEKCHFIGLKASGSLLRIGSGAHRLVIRDTQIGGLSAPLGIEVTSGVRLNMDTVTMWDNGNFKADYFSKTPAGMGAWVHCSGAVTQVGANQHSVAEIRNCLFDEGSTPHIYIEDYHKVEVEKCGFNIRGTDGSYGIHLDTVTHALIKHNNSGYTTADIPFLKLATCGNVALVGQTIDGGVYRVETDATTNLRVIHSEGVTVTEV